MIHFEYKAEGDEEPVVNLVLDEPDKTRQAARFGHIIVTMIECFDKDAAAEGFRGLMFLIDAILKEKEKKVEDKALITKKLCELLRLTSQFYDISDMTYEHEGAEELVRVEFQGGGHTDIDVALDSGSALIRDVLRGLR